MFSILLIVGCSYLLGSIPFGYLLVRIFHGEDVRQSGSGNIGATNVARKSPVLGAITLLLDAAKGAAAVAFADQLMRSQTELITKAGNPWLIAPLVLAALFAVIGHMFPVWLKFRGGKGVATALGSFALIAPKAALVAVAIFVLIVLIFRYISLGSVIAVAAFPVLAWVFHEYGNVAASLAFMSLSSLLIIFKHHANIGRLLAGTENRFGAKRPDRAAATRAHNS
jgi:acyl phosphate:glycerol-3-phosphate acyltransferase